MTNKIGNFPIHVYGACLAFLIGCGVEIGNPKDPEPVTPKYTTNEIDQSLELAAYQIDETLQSLGDNLSIGATTLALHPLLALATELTCSENSDGTATVTKIADEEYEFTRGISNDRTIKGHHQMTQTSTFRNPDETLICRPILGRVRIPWRRVTSLQIDTNIERTLKQEIKRSVSGELIASRNLTVVGSRSRKLERLESDLESNSFQENLAIDINHSGEIQRGEQSWQLESSIATQSDQPLVITRTYDQIGILTTVTVNSGSVVTKSDSGYQLSLSYEQVIINPEDCGIESGVISGQLLNTENSESNASPIKFTIKSEREIVFEDGSTQELDLAPCFLR